MLNCLFCQIIKKKIPAYIVAEDEYCLAFLDINPASEGHTLIITKNHVENAAKLGQDEWCSLFPLFQIVVNKLQKTFQPQGFNFITNLNEVAYQSVFHFHLHIIPKYQKNQGFIWTVRKEKPIDVIQIAKELKIVL
jgi:histidine triad (HIT) family protein